MLTTKEQKRIEEAISAYATERVKRYLGEKKTVVESMALAKP